MSFFHVISSFFLSSPLTLIIASSAAAAATTTATRYSYDIFPGRSRARQGGETGHARNQTEKRVELMRGRLKLFPEGSLDFEWSATL